MTGEAVVAGASGATAKERVLWADSARGIAIVLVALYHATNWLLAAGLPLEAWSELNQVLSTLRMPLFFCVAGLFAGKWLHAGWRELWSSKLSLFAWVFLLWECIGSLALYLGLIMQDRCCGIRETAIALVLSPVAPRFELWFIWALALFFLVAKLLRRVDPRLQIAVAAVVAAIALSGWITPNIGWSGTLKYFVFFLLGIHARELVLRAGRTGGRFACVLAIAVWAAVSTAIWLLDLETVPGVYFADCVLGVVGGIAGARLLSGVGWLRRIGRSTLPIYLTHTPLILILSFALWASPLVAPAGAIWSVVPIIAGAAIALSLLIHRLVSGTPLRLLYEQPRWFAAPRGRGA